MEEDTLPYRSTKYNSPVRLQSQRSSRAEDSFVPPSLPHRWFPNMQLPNCPQEPSAAAAAAATATDNNHARCLKLLSSLSDTIRSVQSFKGRWSSISSILPKLHSAISDLSSLPIHPLSSELLHSLSSTLSLALTLSIHCSSPNPPAGRLLTQSELSSANSSLLLHLSDADLLLSSGILLHHATPSRRDRCRSLVTRLQLTTASSKLETLDSLLHLLRDDDKAVVVSVSLGAVPALVVLLDSPSSTGDVKERAVAALAEISDVESCRGALTGEGLHLLSHLARVVDSGLTAAKESSCKVLECLTVTKENATAIGSGGFIASLLGICESGTPTACARATAVLRNLALVDEPCRRLLAERAVPVLAAIVASGTAAAQENAVDCARHLAAGVNGREEKMGILAGFPAEVLASYWDSRRGVLEPAVGLLRNLAVECEAAELLVRCGFVKRVALALQSGGSTAARAEAARAVGELSKVGAREVVEEGCVGKLVGMLEAKVAEERSAAVKALAAVMEVAGAHARREFRREDNGIGNVVRMLVPGEDGRWAVAVLAAAAESRRCRRRMVEAGAIPKVEKLVQAKVEGSRRLMEMMHKVGNWGGLFRR